MKKIKTDGSRLQLNKKVLVELPERVLAGAIGGGGGGNDGVSTTVSHQSKKCPGVG